MRSILRSVKPPFPVKSARHKLVELNSNVFCRNINAVFLIRIFDA